MIQCWVIIKEGAELSEEELGQVMQLGADQYQKVGLSHDGLELLHCIVDPEVVPMVEEFLTARGQEPGIVKATTINGRRYGFEFDQELGRLVQVIDDALPDDPELLDSFFPEGVPQHQFAGWAT